MTPGWSYALMIVLSFDARAHPVAHVDCQRVRMGR